MLSVRLNSSVRRNWLTLIYLPRVGTFGEEDGENEAKVTRLKAMTGSEQSEIRSEVERRLKRLAKGNDNDEEAKN